MNKKEILKTLKSFQPIFKQEDINLLGLFGSYARDEATKDSDIDILIETTPAFLTKHRGWDAILKLDELKDILKQSLGKEIDIVDKQGLLQHNNHYILDKTIYV